MGARYGTCFMSHFLRLEIWVGCQILGTLVGPYDTLNTQFSCTEFLSSICTEPKMCPTETTACLWCVMLGTSPQSKDACERNRFLYAWGQMVPNAAQTLYVPLFLYLLMFSPWVSCNGKNPWYGWKWPSTGGVVPRMYKKEWWAGLISRRTRSVCV